MTTNTELEIMAAQSQLPAPSVAHMLQAIIQQGVTETNVAALDKLCDLYQKMQTIEAEKQFAQAFVALQAEMPKVNATKAVPNNDGSVRYKFAPFEDLMRQIAPMLQKHGFTVSFSNRYDDSRLVETCTLQHIGGHKRSNDFAVRIGSGPPKASESQADGAAATYAKRFALTDALNIVVEHLDDDARVHGAAVTPEQSASLRERVLNTNQDEAAFLKMAGAVSFDTIPSARFQLLDQSLRNKEKTSVPLDERKKLLAELWKISIPVRGAAKDWRGFEDWAVKATVLGEDDPPVLEMTIERLKGVIETTRKIIS